MTAPMPSVSRLLDLQAAAAEGLEPNLRRFLAFTGWNAGETVELQALEVPRRRAVWASGKCVDTGRDGGSYVAHADTVTRLADLAHEAEGWGGPGVYCILNRVTPAVADRYAPRGQWHRMADKQGTSDGEILTRRALYIDLDADRPKGLSALDAHVIRTFQRADMMAAMLTRYVPAESFGWGHSGNGAGLFLALDNLPCSEELDRLVRGILVACKHMAADPGTFDPQRVRDESLGLVAIDVSVSDRKRLCPAFGTVKAKGAAGVEGRAHRRTAFVASTTPHRLSLDDLHDFADRLMSELASNDARAEMARVLADPKAKAPRPASPASASAPAGSSDGDGFRAANRDIPVHDVLARLGLLDGDRPICPGCRRSSKAGGMVEVLNNALKCSSGTCASQGAPGRPGFRTVTDLVMVAQGVDAAGALAWLRLEFPGANIAPPRGRTPAPEPSRPTAPAAPPARPAPQRQPHHSQLAEHVVAGMGLVQADVLTRFGWLQPDHFHTPMRHVWRAMLDLLAEGVQPGIHDVSLRLQVTGHLETVGGPAAVRRLSVLKPEDVACLDTHAGRIFDLWRLRQLEAAAEQILTACHGLAEDPGSTIADADRAVRRVSEASRRVAHGASIGEAARQRIEQLQAFLQGKATTGSRHSTGFACLNEASSGFGDGELWVLGGRPGLGKTSLALALAVNVAAGSDEGVLFFSLEMGRHDLVERSLSSESGVSLGHIINNTLADEEFFALSDAAERFKSWPVHFDDDAYVTVADIAARAQAEADRLRGIGKPLRLIVVDYLQLVKERAVKGRNREQEVAEISRELKRLAKKLGCTVLALSQLNREGEKEVRLPRSSDLRDSGQIEQDADWIGILYRDKETPRGATCLRICKQRKGPAPMRAVFGWRGECTRFSDYEYGGVADLES